MGALKLWETIQHLTTKVPKAKHTTYWKRWFN